MASIKIRNTDPEVDLGVAANALAVAHRHAPVEHRLLGIQEQSPLHRTLLLVLVAIELHLHLEVWNEQRTQVSIHGTAAVPERFAAERFAPCKRTGSA